MVADMDEGMVLDYNEEELEKAGSSKVTIPPGKNQVVHRIEVAQETGWDKIENKSVKFVVTVIDEGIDFGKQDKISCGLQKKSDGKSGIWKLKELTAALGVDYKSFFSSSKMGDGSSKVVFMIDKFLENVVGKQAYGIWEQTTGWKHGIVGGERTRYPKLITLSKTPVEVEAAGI